MWKDAEHTLSNHLTVVIIVSPSKQDSSNPSRSLPWAPEQNPTCSWPPETCWRYFSTYHNPHAISSKSKLEVLSWLPSSLNCYNYSSLITHSWHLMTHWLTRSLDYLFSKYILSPQLETVHSLGQKTFLLPRKSHNVQSSRLHLGQGLTKTCMPRTRS